MELSYQIHRGNPPSVLPYVEICYTLQGVAGIHRDVRSFAHPEELGLWLARVLIGQLSVLECRQFCQVIRDHLLEQGLLKEPS